MRWLVLSLLLVLFSCSYRKPEQPSVKPSGNGRDYVDTVIPFPPDSPETGVLRYVPVTADVPVKRYFHFMDSLVAANDSAGNWPLNEYILVHANPWILDTLKSFDYYTLMERGIFVYDQTQLVVLHAGDSLAIPDSLATLAIVEKLKSTVVDVNIPEFTLRVFQSGDTLLVCPVRVGRDAEEYLAVAKRKVNLRTPIGVGEIVRISREPLYINPRTGKKYEGTHRDDGKYTLMPIIPWIEPSINGIRYGAMIHPTTNPETLGKAYSHGCIGTSEANAWTIYYNAPIGTRVIFRYQLRIASASGDTVELEDVYHMLDK